MNSRRNASAPRPTRFAWLPAFAYMALIFFMSSRHSLVESVPRHWRFRLIDKVGHLGEYGLLAALLRRPVRDSRLARALGAGAAVVLIASLYGASDELHQYFVPYRSCELGDWLSDTLGAAIAVALLGRLAPPASGA
ncbi:MAG: VanZ family protein [Candidatus Wallbacteria bacterium]|nr:VanZ family protein [Candidatus Wallbacteria bacterium]